METLAVVAFCAGLAAFVVYGQMLHKPLTQAVMRWHLKRQAQKKKARDARPT